MSVYQRVADKFENIAGSAARAQLQPVGTASTLTPVVTVSTTQTVDISPQISSGTGTLPAGVQRVPSENALQQQLAHEMQQLQQQVQQGLQQWAQQDHSTYRRLLAHGRLFPSSSPRYGCEWHCTDCNGHGHLLCGQCGGNAVHRCHGCGGKGTQSCPQCNGFQSFTCRSCHGNPVRYETVTESVWSDAQKGFVPVYRQVTHYCEHCGRTGRERCMQCDMFGQVRCSGCHGSGQLHCSACAATGKVACNGCAATGIQHKEGHLELQIQTEDGWAADMQDPQLRAVLSNHVPCQALGQLGTLRQVQHHPQGLQVRSDYTLSLPIEQSDITHAGARHRIFGFGPQTEIFDYDGLLHKANLMVCHSLEQVIDTGYPWSPRRYETLNRAFNDFTLNPSTIVLATDPYETQINVQDLVQQSSGTLDAATAQQIITTAKRYGQAVMHATSFPWSMALFAIVFVLYFVAGDKAEPVQCTSGHKWSIFLYGLPIACVMGLYLRQQLRDNLRLGMFIADTEILARQHIKQWAGLALGAIVAGVWLAYGLQVLWRYLFTHLC